MPSFSIPLTGLKADSTALNTIANNLSNMNTTAFKAQSTSFSDLFYQQVGTAGSGDPLQLGAGTQVSSTSTNFTGGGINSTSNDTDVAINGTGFFLVQNAGVNQLTRAGNFTTDSNGKLTTQSGLQLMGYPAANGVVNTNSALVPLSLPIGQAQGPKATGTLTLTGTLDAGASPSIASSTISFGGTLALSAPVNTTATETIQIYDSKGVSHSANVTFTNTTAAVASPPAAAKTNAVWSYSVSVPDATGGVGETGTVTFDGNTGVQNAHTVTAPQAAGFTFADGASALSLGPIDISALNGGISTAFNSPVQNGVAGGATAQTMQVYDSLGKSHNATITFTKDSTALNTWEYNITLPAGDYSGAASKTTGKLVFDSSGNLTTPSANLQGISFAGLTDGASDLSFNWNLFDANQKPLISQIASATASGIASAKQDGYTGGKYSGFSIDSDGVIAAKYDNGQTSSIGQIAIATVTNQQGLMRMGDNNYETTLASGSATAGVANSGGRGTLKGDALEGSNVDISTEFSNLIVAQRAFEANSKSITTFDTVTQDTLNLIH